jgi:succinate-acetate transporter protein
LLPSWGIAASYSPTGNPAEGALSVGYNTAIGFYLVFWGFGLFTLLICSARTNIVFLSVFIALVVGVFALAGAYFRVAAGDMAMAARLQKVWILRVG